VRTILVAAVLGLLAAAPAAGAFDRVITPRGAVGGLSVTHAAGTTMADVRKQEGRKASRVVVNPADDGSVYSYDWFYPCAGGHRSMYEFDYARTLIAFTTTCTNWRTKAGTRVGDTWSAASKKEGRKPVADGCLGGFDIERHTSVIYAIRFSDEFGRADKLQVWRNNWFSC
jgi:hypothetical protein